MPCGATGHKNLSNILWPWCWKITCWCGCESLSLKTWKFQFFSPSNLVVAKCQFPTRVMCVPSKNARELALHFTKSRGYHVFVCKRNNNEHHINNPSQGSESTPYHAFECIAEKNQFQTAIFFTASHNFGVQVGQHWNCFVEHELRVSKWTSLFIKIDM